MADGARYEKPILRIFPRNINKASGLGMAMLAYNLMNLFLFRQAVLRSCIAHTLSTLHGLVLAVGTSCRRRCRHVNELSDVRLQ